MGKEARKLPAANLAEWAMAMGGGEVKDDPYQVLGVQHTASQREIREAFMELARVYHPDKFPEDVASAKLRFDRIKQAYDSIRTEEIRAKTDSKMGVTDLFTEYASQGSAVIAKLVRQTGMALKDDPDALPAEAGVDEHLREQGSVVVKYYAYAL